VQAVTDAATMTSMPAIFSRIDDPVTW
jgi:hypothetical protein